MQKRRKTFMLLLTLLLCLTLISSCILSGTMAKYVMSETASASVSFKKLGLTATSGTDLSSSYKLVVDIDGDGTDDEINAVHSTQNVIAPGTHGCLAWVRIKGTPEVEYDLDFTGSISVGDGYYDSSGLIRNSSGKAIDYFPVIIYMIAYDVKAESNGVLTLEYAGIKNSSNKNIKYGLANFRKNHTTDKIQNDYIFRSDVDDGRASFALDTLLSVLNGTYGDYEDMALSKAFDHSGTTSTTAIDRIYTVQWYWPYNHADNNYLFSNEKQDGNTGGFLKREYDSQIAEAIANGSTAFTVTADLDVEIKQSNLAT